MRGEALQNTQASIIKLKLPVLCRKKLRFSAIHDVLVEIRNLTHDQSLYKNVIWNTQNVVYPFNRILFCHEKTYVLIDITTDTYHNMDEPWKHDVKCKKPDTKGHILCDYMKSLEQAIRKAEWYLAPGPRAGGEWKWLLIGTWFLCGMMKMSCNEIVVMVSRHCRCTNATELYTLKWIKR